MLLFRIDTHYLSMLCSACMKTSTEIFDKLKVTIVGNDGWKADWVRILSSAQSIAQKLAKQMDSRANARN